VGKADRAIAALKKLLSISDYRALAEKILLTPAVLPFDPMFDPRFQEPCKDKQRVNSRNFFAEIESTGTNRH
jgi:hypothetical protein